MILTDLPSCGRDWPDGSSMSSRGVKSGEYVYFSWLWDLTLSSIHPPPKKIKNVRSKSVYTEIQIILVLSLEIKYSEILKYLTFNFLQNRFQEFGETNWNEYKYLYFNDSY